jgi:RNA polymerase sigma-70 factor (ECF subfamily)
MQVTRTISLYQPVLHAIAYNLVRCKEDAEDIVQETFLKWLSLEPHRKIDDLKSYLIKSVINNCRNHLKSFQKKKIEVFSHVNMPEIMNRFREMNLNQIDLEINLSAALKVIQEKLQPLERAIYVLREVFDMDYETLQETLHKKKEHCRQLFCRAKEKLNKEKLSTYIELPDTLKLKEAFKKACHLGHMDELIQELKSVSPSK